MRVEDGVSFVEDVEGTKHFQTEPIWDGYLQHWTGSLVRGCQLAQRDYDSGRPIVLLAPEVCRPTVRPYLALYYNERLTGYVASLFGHLAVDIDGTVFNFSHLLNEDEAISLEEFLYRPSLGEFAPHPQTSGFNIDDPQRPYYDKFGRLFMRSVHALVVEGLDIESAREVFQSEVDVIHAAPIDPQQPEKYRDFHFLRRSCVTIVRDCLHRIGLTQVRGVLPRELFVSAAHCLFEEHRKGSLNVSVEALSQLKVAERAYSSMTPLINPLNRLRAQQLRREFKISI